MPMPTANSKKVREVTRSTTFPENTMKNMKAFSPNYFRSLLISPTNTDRNINITDIRQTKPRDNFPLNEKVCLTSVNSVISNRPYKKMIIV